MDVSITPTPPQILRGYKFSCIYPGANIMSKKIRKPYSKIKELREKQGLTQQEMAEMLEITHTSIANWENNRALLDKIEILSKLCTILECQIHDLFGYTHEITEQDAKDERLKIIQDRLHKKQQEQTDK